MEDLALLIPIIGVSIPLVVVVGRFIVQPIVTALARHSDSQQSSQQLAPMTQRLMAAEERIQLLERSLERVTAEQEFQRQLTSSRPASRTMTE